MADIVDIPVNIWSLRNVYGIAITTVNPVPFVHINRDTVLRVING